MWSTAKLECPTSPHRQDLARHGLPSGNRQSTAWVRLTSPESTNGENDRRLCARLRVAAGTIDTQCPRPRKGPLSDRIRLKWGHRTRMPHFPKHLHRVEHHFKLSFCMSVSCFKCLCRARSHRLQRLVDASTSLDLSLHP